MTTRIEKLVYDTSFKMILAPLSNVFAKLISDCLGLPYQIFKDNIIIENSELKIHYKYEKSKTCDFIVSIDNNIINIELNKANYKGLTERNLAYVFNIYSEHTEKGSKYEEYENIKVFQLNFNCFRNINGRAVSKQLLMDEHSNEILTETLQIYQIDIEKCYEIWYNGREEGKLQKVIRWGAILNATTLEEIEKMLGDDLLEMEEKEKLIKKISDTNQNLDYLDNIRFENQEEYERRCLLRTGREEGIEQGIEKGKEEEKKNIVLSMLKKNLSIDIISEITNKSTTEIKKIAESL